MLQAANTDLFNTNGLKTKKKSNLGFWPMDSRNERCSSFFSIAHTVNLGASKLEDLLKKDEGFFLVKCFQKMYISPTEMH